MPMPDILTPEEKEALAMSFEAVGCIPAANEPVLAVFPSVSQLRPEETALLHDQLEAWAGDIAAELGAQLQAACSTDFGRVQTQPISGLVREGELNFWAALDGGAGQGVLLTLPGEMAAAICERSFGGPLECVPEHPLTLAETRLMQQLTRGWFTRLSSHWRGHTLQTESRPAGIPLSDPDESLGWIRFTVELKCGPVTGNISVSMAPSTVRLTQGTSGTYKATSVNASELLSRLGTVPLEVSGILGRARFSLDELANLRVGDVIFLDQKLDELVEVQVCGRPRFKARPGLNGQTVALELIEPYSENKHE